MIPTSDEFANHMGLLGITNDTHVIIYDNASAVQSAARVLWTFRVFGHQGGVSILDGGLVKWKHDGYPVDTELVQDQQVQPVKYEAKLNKNLLKTFENMKENLSSKKALVFDARSTARYVNVYY